MRTVLVKINRFPVLSETFVLSQISIAIDAGFDVKLLVKEHLGYDKNINNSLIKKYDMHSKIIREEYQIPKSFLSRLITAFFLLLKNLYQIGPLVRFYLEKQKFSLFWIYQFNFYNQFKKIDVIHVQYGTNLFPIDSLKKVGLLRGKVVVSFHGHDAFFPINGVISDNDYYGNLFINGNIVVSNTNYLAEKIIDLGCSPDQMVVIPVGVDTNFFTPPTYPYGLKKNKKINLLAVGRLHKIKGHKFLISAISKLISKGYYDVELIIIGEGKERKYLEELIQELKLEKIVNLVGAQSQLKIKKYLQGSDIFLMGSTSLEDGRSESQGLVVLEAQACSIPVVAFNSGGVKYTLKDGLTGFLCPEKDINCFVDRIILLMNPVLRRSMGTEGRAFVQKNFSKDVIQNQWKVLYNSLLT